MTLHLGISHLTTLLAVAETGSLTGAAKRLRLTQPAVSQRLREAERRVGGVLFYREAHGLRPTPAGERLLKAARVIVRELEGAEREAGAAADGMPSTIRVGSRAYTCHHWAPEFLLHAREVLPQLDIELMPQVSGDPVDGLLDARIDVAMVTAPPIRPGLETIPLFGDEVVAVVHPGHPWASRAQVATADFGEEVYVAYGERSGDDCDYERFIQSRGIVPRRLLRVGLVDAAIEFVAAGHGVSLLANCSTIRSSSAGRIVRRQLADRDAQVQWSAVIRASESPHSPVRRFCQMVGPWSAARLEIFGGVEQAAAHGEAPGPIRAS